MFLEKKTSGFSQVAARQRFRVDVLTFVERKGKREGKEETHAESSKKHPLYNGHEESILHGDKVLLNSVVSVN